MKKLILILTLTYQVLPCKGESNWILKSANTVKTLKVLQQNGFDCFFHALKNGLYVHKWQIGKLTEKECNNKINSNQSKFFPLESWRNLTKNKFGQATNLDDRAGQYLVEFARMQDNCTIISNLFELAEFTKQKDQHLAILDLNLANLIKELRISKDKVHAFMLGDMQHKQDPSTQKISSTNGHWIAIVVAKKNNELIYYVMDSLSRDNSKLCKQFAYLVEETKLF